ncbi:MAG: 30S ribosome-binding factor RbfA [Betaproteobacteria bacterium]|nr:MAG: 30S ribosome-binding factor RbfA [Betaproteobacteria bacterium]
MPRGPARSLRVADQIQRELAEIIRTELKDPRVAMITLTGVEVTADYAHAKVFYTLMGSAEQRAETEVGLKKAGGFLRSQLARRIKLHSIPQLHFVYDASVERGFELSRLIDAAVADSKEPRG